MYHKVVQLGDIGKHPWFMHRKYGEWIFLFVANVQGLNLDKCELKTPSNGNWIK